MCLWVSDLVDVAKYVCMMVISGARWLSGLERRPCDRQFLGSNLGQVNLPHVAWVSQDASSISENDGSRSQTKGGFI